MRRNSCAELALKGGVSRVRRVRITDGTSNKFPLILHGPTRTPYPKVDKDCITTAASDHCHCHCKRLPLYRSFNPNHTASIARKGGEIPTPGRDLARHSKKGRGRSSSFLRHKEGRRGTIVASPLFYHLLWEGEVITLIGHALTVFPETQ